MTTEKKRATFTKVAFFVLCAQCFAPLLHLPSEIASWTAPAALVIGVVLALTIGQPYLHQTKRVSKLLLQASVVFLGFSMDIGKVAEAGRDGLVFSLSSITVVFILGLALRHALKIRPVIALLVSAGTAICGGSAIAAVSSVVDAEAEDVSVAVATVFLLNALALMIFPPLGHLLGLSQHQFGVWSGIAIHDIASVVGAGTAYGPEALDVGTAVKLSRVLFLVPVTLIIAFFYHRKLKSERKAIQIPWFVGLFLLASLARNQMPVIAAHTGEIKQIASAGFTLCLFLIGSALTRTAMKSVGARPLLLGVLLWVAISVGSLVVVLRG